MQSLRRVALRSAVSASRAVTPKVAKTSLAVQFSGSNANISRTCGVSVSRFFSQTARVANIEESEPQAGETNAMQNSRASEKPTEEEIANGVFIRNMVFDATEDHLREIFEKFGTVVSARIMRDARGLSKGFGFVTMETPQAAAQAIEEVNGSFWHGRRVQCAKRTRPSKDLRNSSEPTKYVYIGNIPYETTDAELNRLFKSLDNVEDIRVAVDRVTGWPRGFAHADFIDVESAQKAFQKLNGMQLGGRQLRVDFTLGPPPKKNAGGQQQQQQQQSLE